MGNKCRRQRPAVLAACVEQGVSVFFSSSFFCVCGRGIHSVLGNSRQIY